MSEPEPWTMPPDDLADLLTLDDPEADALDVATLLRPSCLSPLLDD